MPDPNNAPLVARQTLVGPCGLSQCYAVPVRYASWHPLWFSLIGILTLIWLKLELELENLQKLEVCGVLSRRFGL